MTTSALALSALVVFSPGAAHGVAGAAPAPDAVIAVAAPGALVASPEAQRLFQEAFTLFADRESWGKAARLFERSGELRAAEDPDRVTAYLLAARLYVHVGSLKEAQQSFATAAEAAGARGAVMEAAHAYLDGAMVAMMRGREGEAEAMVQKGELLSHSPHLDSGEKSAIRTRIPAQALASS